MNLLQVWITLPAGETTQLGEVAFGDLSPDGKAWLGNRGEAKRIADEVITAVAGFSNTAEELGVAPDSVAHFAADIGKRLERLRESL